MIIIWYNAETSQYQKGNFEELEKQRLSCNSPESCTKLFEFNPTSERLIDQILHTLVTNHPGDNLSFATS